MSYHNSSNHLNLQHDNEHMYFSRITQQWEPVWFYASMLKKLSSFAQAIDRCPASSRELVWSLIFSLYNQPNRKCSDVFTPIIDEWCHSQSIDLSAIEIMYSAFLQIYNQYPSLFEDLLPPSQSFPSDHSLSYSSGFTSPDKSEHKKDENKQAKTTKLSNTSLIWGNSFASSVQQFSLLLSWAQLLEKLPPNQKEAIWNTCQFFPLFSDAFDRSSFRKTFLKRAGNLPAHLSHVTILFGAIGFLREKGIIKHQFFYPNTTVPVFNNGMKTQTPSPAPQYYPASPSSAPVSPSPSTSPISMNMSMSPMSRSSPIPIPSSAPSMASSSRSSSPAIHDQYQSNHFYPSPSPSPSADRKAKSLPFESLSLPPLSLPSPSPSKPAAGSRLGLLALAAFQVDDPADGVPANSLPFPPLAGLKAGKEQENSLIPPPMKLEEESRADTAPAATENQSKESKETKDKAPTVMKIIKRKNSCSEWNDEESKRPRTMNLSHILCS